MLWVYLKRQFSPDACGSQVQRRAIVLPMPANHYLASGGGCRPPKAPDKWRCTLSSGLHYTELLFVSLPWLKGVCRDLPVGRSTVTCQLSPSDQDSCGALARFQEPARVERQGLGLGKIQ